MHDLVIKGGTIVDGVGTAKHTSDVAVADGVIVEVGKITSDARQTIDADGLLVTPGWVDIHTHYDGQVTWDPLLTPSFWQGGHHRRNGQLRRRVCTCRARTPRVVDRPDGGR